MSQIGRFLFLSISINRDFFKCLGILLLVTFAVHSILTILRYATSRKHQFFWWHSTSEPTFHTENELEVMNQIPDMYDQPSGLSLNTKSTWICILNTFFFKYRMSKFYKTVFIILENNIVHHWVIKTFKWYFII